MAKRRRRYVRRATGGGGTTGGATSTIGGAIGGTNWVWRDGGPTPPVDANVFAAELERLADGDPIEMVEPDVIWQAARDRRSPLFACFNWNVQEAAEAHWRDHARSLVGRLLMVRVHTTAGPTVSSRGWWSVSIDKRKGYVHEDKIMSSLDLRLQTMATAKRELHSYLAKFLTVIGDIGYVVPRLQQSIQDIQEEIDRLERDARTPPPPPPPRGRRTPPPPGGLGTPPPSSPPPPRGRGPAPRHLGGGAAQT